ncbi:MAG: TetR/AcrR family transcriptional regulator [Chloroflexota bacterium]
MSRVRNPELKRRQIIDAAHKILREGGYFKKFSLDSVAKEAGVSKGGLIHHFESKDALLTAVSQDAARQFESRVAKEQDNASQAPGDFLKSYINAVFKQEIEINSQLSPMLLSYISGENNNTRFEFWQKCTDDDGIDPILGTIMRLAIDGLIYAEMIDKKPIDPTLRQAIQQRLLKIVEAEKAHKNKN